MNKEPLISVITINYNQSEATNQFLQSMQKTDWKNLEILVVDNNSEYVDYEKINSQFTNTRILRSETNLGFAGANNFGVLHSNGDYILFINNDTEVDPGFLGPLVDAFGHNDRTGLVSPRIRFFNSPEMRTIQFAGGYEAGFLSCIPHFKGFKEYDIDQYNESGPTPVIHGAAVMTTREALKEAGLWPDIYFLYYEEIDWGERFKKSGFKLKYVHNSLVFHKESLSVGKSSPLRTYYMTRNRILYLRRNFKGIRRLTAILMLILFSLPSNFAGHLVKGELKHLKSLWKGMLWHIQSRKELYLQPLLKETNGGKKIVGGYINY